MEWKISRNRTTKVTTLQVSHPNGDTAASGSGKDIWEARENALAQAASIEVQNYIAAHFFPDVE